MTVTIIILLALLFLVAIVGGVRLLYSFTLPNSNSLQSDMKTKALDVFIYLGIGISLVTSVTNLLQILFAAVDRRFVDILSGTSYVDTTQSDVRFAIASLVVMFPIYVGLSWYTANDIKKFLYKQDIPVRKIMVYCTLFVTVLTLIGTLVSVIYTYLGGELSIRFGLKAVSVFVLALALFSYYYYSLRRDYSKVTIIPTGITIIASVLVILAVVWSVSIVGSPSVMRAKKIDNTRLTDISAIQQQILNHVNMTDKLPLTLGELDNAFQGYLVQVDPVTKEEYVYKIIQQPVFTMNYTTKKKELTTSAIFELCATFDTVRIVDSRGQAVVTSPIATDKDGISPTDPLYSANNVYYEGDVSPFWNHSVGLVCFKRIISSEMYYGR